MFKKLILLLGNGLAAVTAAGLLARFVPPDIWWPPAVIALLLPGLILLTFLFALWGLYQRRWTAAFLPVVVSLAVLPMFNRLFSLSVSSATEAPTAHVTLLTANVRMFKNAAFQSIDPALRTRFMKEAAPDILLLQEAHDQIVPAVQQATGLQRRHQPRKKTIATYADNVKFISDKFQRSGRVNGILVTDVTTDIGVIRVINAHLQSNRISDEADDIGSDADVGKEIDRAESMLRSYGRAAGIRAKQAEDIRRMVRESPHPVIVGGDFNDVPSSYTYQRIRTDRLRDAWADHGFGIGTTFTGPLPFLRIDFLLVDKSLTIHEVERVETGFSDHRGLRVVVSKGE